MKAVALYDFDADTSDHLTFKTGDILLIFQKEASGWWGGTDSQGQSGWFPASYVEAMDSSDGSSKRHSISTLDSWEKFTTDDHKAYYVSKKTGESRWDLPQETQIGSAPPLPQPSLSNASPVCVSSLLSNQCRMFVKISKTLATKISLIKLLSTMVTKVNSLVILRHRISITSTHL